MDLYSLSYIYSTYISLLDSQGISGMEHIKPKVKMTLIFWNRTTSIFNLLHHRKTERSDIMKGIGDCSFWKRSKCSYFVIDIQNSGTWAFSIGSYYWAMCVTLNLLIQCRLQYCYHHIIFIKNVTHYFI